MNTRMSDEERKRYLINVIGMTKEQADHYLAVECGKILDDVEVIDGPLTDEDRKRLGYGSIFDAPTRGGSVSDQE